MALALGCVLLACGGLATPSALAVPQHSFDAALSLEGSCKGEDGVEDPGCPEGQHPLMAFDDACGTAVDRHGDIYVASGALGNGSGKGGRIDVFNAQGEFLSEIKDEHQPCSLAVDSEGNVYTAEYQGKNAVLFEPKSYPPQAGEKYTSTIVFDSTKKSSCKAEAWSVAVDPSNDHLYVGLECMIAEYASAAEGSGLIREGLGKPLPILAGIDVYGANHDLYVTSAVPGSLEGQPQNARLYVLDGTSGKVECEAGGFSFVFGNSGVGVDQANGDAYVDDTSKGKRVRQFNAGCGEIGQLPEPPVLEQPTPFADIAVDDPCLIGTEPCNPSAPYSSPNESYVFLGSGAKADNSHLYAYAPNVKGPPEIKDQEVSGVSGSEATLEAKVNPHGSDTTYHFEYVTQAQFDESKYAEALSTPEEDAGAAASFGAVSAAVSGLAPGTAYRFRAVASNCKARGIEDEVNCLTVGEGNPGGEGEDASFATYPTPPQQQCLNEALRSGPSVGLPDCRAYELVTPAQTNGLIPTMSELGHTNEDGFDTDLASADGESLAFGVNGGSLPVGEGNGFHDTYVAQRGQDGWQSEFAGLRGSEATEVYVGGIGPDNQYSFFFADDGGAGSLARGNYLRGPGGTVEPIGFGSLGTNLNATGNLVTAGGGHVIFIAHAHDEEQEIRLGANTTGGTFALSFEGETSAPIPYNVTAEQVQSALAALSNIGAGNVAVSAENGTGSPYTVRFTGSFADRDVELLGSDASGLTVSKGSATVEIKTTTVAEIRLEPGATENGTSIYDRSVGEETKVVSLLPGDETPSAGVAFQSVSADGSTVAFKVNGILYLRRGGETQEVAAGNPVFGGLSASGGRLTYLVPNGAPKGIDPPHGDVFSFDAASGETAAVGSGGESILVNVSADGSRVFFVKPGSTGSFDLYVWDAATEALSFIAAVTERDVFGEEVPPQIVTERMADGLGLWVNRVLNPVKQTAEGPGADPSRSTPDGRAFVFESRANGKQAEIYRYSDEEGLSCISCNPTGVPAQSDARLQSQIPEFLRSLPPVNSLAHIPNLSTDGQLAFFQSADPLVAADNDGKVDVYEWEAEGRGGCQLPAGCLSLISSGHSTTDNYLYAATPDGHDVYIETTDPLLPADPDGGYSIYDARENGGFAEAQAPAGPCQGADACRAPSPPPALPSTLGGGPFAGQNAGPAAGRKCPKGKHRVRARGGKARCAKSHHAKNRRRGGKGR